jgi:hypothetical protein
MNYLKSFEIFNFFENINLSIGDNTNFGIITDITDTQVEIDNNWISKKIISKKLNIDKDTIKKIHNKGKIDPNLVISAFSNPIDSNKIEEYSSQMLALDHNFPPILGYPTIINDDDLGKSFINGIQISEKYFGKYAWIVTDGHHRTITALNNELPYLETKLDYSYIDDNYYTESMKHKI